MHKADHGTPTLAKPLNSFSSDQFLERLNNPAPENRRLRKWVDEWIATGRSFGVDDPQGRSFERAPSLKLALFTFSQNHLRLYPTGTELIPAFDDSERVMKGTDYPLETVAQVALLMMSPLRFNIAGCASCSRYFFLRKSRCLYKRGTHCTACQRAARARTSGAIIADQRRWAAEELYMSVAKRFASLLRANEATWHTDLRVRVRVVSHLNQVIGKSNKLKAVYKNLLTPKWVNEKNRAGILRAIGTE